MKKLYQTDGGYAIDWGLSMPENKNRGGTDYDFYGCDFAQQLSANGYRDITPLEFSHILGIIFEGEKQKLEKSVIASAVFAVCAVNSASLLADASAKELFANGLARSDRVFAFPSGNTEETAVLGSHTVIFKCKAAIPQKTANERNIARGGRLFSRLVFADFCEISSLFT